MHISYSIPITTGCSLGALSEILAAAECKSIAYICRPSIGRGAMSVARHHDVMTRALGGADPPFEFHLVE